EFESGFEALARRRDAQDGGIPGGRGLQLDAEVLELPGDLVGGAGAGPGLEGIGREPSEPRLARGVAGRARVDDEHRSHERQVAVARGQDGEIVVEAPALDGWEDQGPDLAGRGRPVTL